MPELPELFRRIYERHGHRCPMSTLGGRLGLAALARLGDGNGDLRADYGARTCALDGIAETTGCREDDGSLQVSGSGRHALGLERAGRRIELEISAGAMQRAGTYRKLCNELEKGWDQFDEVEQQRRRQLMETALDELLPYLWSAEDHELITILAENEGLD